MIRVLIADHNRLRREGLRMLVNGEADMATVADVRTPADAASTAMEHRPDIVLMAVDRPGRECFEAAKRIQESLPNTRVVAISGDRQDDTVAQALEVSTWGYALADNGFDELRAAIHDVHAGRSHYAKAALSRVVTSDGQPRIGQAPKTRLQSLTPREKELLTLLARGYSLKKACRTLQVSYKTADKHKVNLMKKLDIHDRVELARFAIREKLVEP